MTQILFLSRRNSSKILQGTNNNTISSIILLRNSNINKDNNNTSSLKLITSNNKWWTINISSNQFRINSRETRAILINNFRDRTSRESNRDINIRTSSSNLFSNKDIIQVTIHKEVNNNNNRHNNLNKFLNNFPNSKEIKKFTKVSWSLKTIASKIRGKCSNKPKEDLNLSTTEWGIN